MSGGSPFSPSWFGRLRRHFTFRRALVNTGMVIYCLALLLLFDFVYSTLTAGEDARRARIPNPVYDHGFAPDFDGYDIWGEVRYRFITDSLGFKDGSVRKVPLQAAHRRILLVGIPLPKALEWRSRTASPVCSIAPARSERKKSNSSMPPSHPTRQASTTRRSRTSSKRDFASTRSCCSPTPPMWRTKRRITSASMTIRNIVPIAGRRKDQGSRGRRR